MFKVSAEPTFQHTVEVQVPVDGGHEKQTFKTTYRVIDFDKLQEIEAKDGVKGVCKAIIVTFDDLVGDDEQPVSYSDTLRDQLLAQAYVQVAIYDTYEKACTKARTGN